MKHIDRCYYDAEGDRQAFENYYANQCGHGSFPLFLRGENAKRSRNRRHFQRTVSNDFSHSQKVIPTIGRQAMETGMQIVKDVAGGQESRQSSRGGSNSKRYK